MFCGEMFPRKIFLTILSIILSNNFVNLHANIIKDAHAEVELVSEVESVQTGNPFWVALHLKMDKGWHSYWKNEGDAGLPTKIQWELPNGFKAGPLEWPYPKKIKEPTLMSYGYEGEVFLLTKIEPPPTLTAGQIKIIKARVDWIACKAGCIAGHADLELRLPIKNEIPKINPRWTKGFAIARSTLPLKKGDWNIAAENRDRTILIRLSYPSGEKYTLSEVYFFPERNDIIEHAAVQTLKKTGEGYELYISRSPLSSNSLTRLKGVLFSKEGWRGPDTEQALLVDVPVK